MLWRDVVFVRAPTKYLYGCPDWEKQYLSTMYYFGEKGSPPEMREQARALTLAMMVEHPESVIVHWCQALMATNENDKTDAVEMAWKTEPWNPLVGVLIADDLCGQGEYRQAYEVLSGIEQRGRANYLVLAKLAAVECALEDCENAERHGLQALSLNRDYTKVWWTVFLAREFLRRRDEALVALHEWAIRRFEEPWRGYERASKLFFEYGDEERGEFYKRKAMELKGESTPAPAPSRAPRT
jgi:hypothetical protein